MGLVITFDILCDEPGCHAMLSEYLGGASRVKEAEIVWEDTGGVVTPEGYFCVEHSR